jgi:hypothetical protein
MKSNEKKLGIKKETLRELTARDLAGINGGITATTTSAIVVITATVTTLTETCKCSTSNLSIA